MLPLDQASTAEHEGVFDSIGQLTDVPWEFVFHESSQDIVGDSRYNLCSEDD